MIEYAPFLPGDLNLSSCVVVVVVGVTILTAALCDWGFEKKAIERVTTTGQQSETNEERRLIELL